MFELTISTEGNLCTSVQTAQEIWSARRHGETVPGVRDSYIHVRSQVYMVERFCLTFERYSAR